MVAAPAETPATAPEATPVAYNWETQNAGDILTEDELNAGASGSFSFIPGSGGQQTVDDWHLC